MSERLLQYIADQLARRQPHLQLVETDFQAALATCDLEEATVLRYFYATMPLRDMAAYGADIFADYAKHAMMLRRNVEWCKLLPEETFLHHVAYYRVNSENIEPCRGEFFSMLYPRILGKTITEAVLEVNYWCGENVQYAASDMRTISPLTAYRSGIGRCGEESTFTVTALRSLGIPARQVYTPRWAHCDDNHAWVEVYTQGAWHFLGACEPDEALDRGWFTAAAARAMLIHSRVFGGYPDHGEPAISKEGLLSFYNSTQIYAQTKPLCITVYGADGAPKAGVKISLEIFNMAELVPLVKLTTGENGKANITLGKGQVLAVAKADGLLAAALVAPEEESVSLLLREASLAGVLTETLRGTVDFLAPPAVPGKGAKLTPEQKERGAKRLKEAAALREAKQDSFFDAKRVERYPQAEQLLREARANFNVIYRFLHKVDAQMRIQMLQSLSTKDLRDVTCAVLEPHYQSALALMDRVRLGTDAAGAPVFGKAPEDIFVSCVLCPRAGDEELTDYRGALVNAFSPEQHEAFLKSPKALADWIAANISCVGALDYTTVYATPKGALALKDANRASRHILFVCACRSLGIPARLNPYTRQAEYYENGAFLPAWAEISAHTDAQLRLHTEQAADMVYYTTWTLALQVEDAYQTLECTEARFDAAGDLCLDLQAGNYRLITTARMPNGNQKVDTVFFTLSSGDIVCRTLALQGGELSDYLMDVTLPELTLTDRNGISFVAQERYGGEKRVLAFIEEGGEPTEHVLNELLDKCAAGGVAYTPVLVVRSFEALENRTLARVLEAMPRCEVCTMDFDVLLEPLARHMFTDHEKLPLLLVTNAACHGVYATSGYRVGSVDLLEKLLAAIA